MEKDDREEKIYEKLKADGEFSDLDCEYLAYYESLKSRGDSDHAKGTDPFVGAVVRENGRVIAHAHRANAFEGDHAEHSILKGQLNGRDLSQCDFFTTLEPCVDSVRKQVGSSCSSLLCSSAVKRIHIGILDSSNSKVFGKGIEELFSAGKTLIPFSAEVRELIESSWPGFSAPQRSEKKEMERVATEVFPKFQEGALERYLEDRWAFRQGGKGIGGFDLSIEKETFALSLLRRGLVSFSAKKFDIDPQLKIMFFPPEALKASSRQIRVRYDDGAEAQDVTIDDALPLAYEKLMGLYSGSFDLGGLDKTAYKEAVVNALVHSDYGENAPLIYLTKRKGLLSIRNKASDNIPEEYLGKLVSYSTPSYPGNGLLADLFNKAGYCERDEKGLMTFREASPKPVYEISGHMVTLTFKTI